MLPFTFKPETWLGKSWEIQTHVLDMYAYEHIESYGKPREVIAISCQFYVGCICLFYAAFSPKWLLP